MPDLDVDLVGSLAVTGVVAVGAVTARRERSASGRDLLAGALRPVVRAFVGAGISANAITGASLVAGAVAGVALALGHFGVGAVAVLAASLGDALDGLVARATRTASAGGALFDSSVDRYEEFLVLAGLAIWFRSNAVVLVLALLALLASFMVSYGSAKAEALHVPVPGGVMRRAHRAVCVGAGVTLVPLAVAGVHRLALPPVLADLPVSLSLGIVALTGNVSAVRRLRSIAASASGGRG